MQSSTTHMHIYKLKYVNASIATTRWKFHSYDAAASFLSRGMSACASQRLARVIHSLVYGRLCVRAIHQPLMFSGFRRVPPEKSTRDISYHVYVDPT